MLHCLALVLALAAAPEKAADVVVVCPAEFRTALTPWIDYRTAEGHAIRLVSNLLTPEQIRGEIRTSARGGKLRFVVLVGDDEPTARTDSAVRARCVPTHLAVAKVNVHWGSEPQIATDNWYADLDDDGVPDVAIGRLTADTAAELSRIVAKTLAYERNTDFGPWRRRVSFIANPGHFGALADAAIESAAKKLITDGLPAAYETTMTYGNWRSPYCPDPRSFRQVAIRRLTEGCLFWVYIGDGDRREVDWVKVPGGQYPILASDDLRTLPRTASPPIALMLACYTGAFDGPQDCLGEEMLRSEGGPVAVYCGSRVTMPYAMSVMCLEAMDDYVRRRPATLGELLMHAKQQMVRVSSENPQRQVLDFLAKAVSPAGIDPAAERAEHVLLFNLLGDPLLRLHHPQEVKLEIAGPAIAGESLEVTGTSPIAGRCTVELVARRDRLTFTPPERREYDSQPAALADYRSIYERSNDLRWSIAESSVVAKSFHARVPVPTETNGACQVRVFVEGASDFAAGAAEINIRAASTPPAGR